MRALIVLAALAMPTLAAAEPRNCLIDVTRLDFGLYSGLSQTPTVAMGRLTVRCIPQVENAPLPTVRISTGNSGHYLDRVMTSGEAELHYNLYAEPTHRLVLGDGSAGTVTFPGGRLRGIWPIFGRIQPGQRVPAGIYSDTLLIELEF